MPLCEQSTEASSGPIKNLNLFPRSSRNLAAIIAIASFKSSCSDRDLDRCGVWVPWVSLVPQDTSDCDLLGTSRSHDCSYKRIRKQICERSGPLGPCAERIAIFTCDKSSIEVLPMPQSSPCAKVIFLHAESLAVSCFDVALKEANQSRDKLRMQVLLELEDLCVQICAQCIQILRHFSQELPTGV